MTIFIYSLHVSAGNYTRHQAVLQREASTSVLPFYTKCRNEYDEQKKIQQYVVLY